MAIFEIKIYFDTICAWCYIGHRTLLQAIDLFQKTYPDGKSDEFRLIWLPFYRDRTLPQDGIPLEQRLVSVFGEERTSNEKARVQRIGRAHGINFALKGNIGHTRNCHRLIHFAGIKGGSDLQKLLIEQIYFQWFEIGNDITALAFLADCAQSAGMDNQEVESILGGSEFAEEVDQLDANARHERISSVPTFIINGVKTEGASDVETFYQTFVQARHAYEE